MKSIKILSQNPRMSLFLILSLAILFTACRATANKGAAGGSSSDNVVLSAFRWRGTAGGDLLDAANWSGGVAPGATDVLVFDQNSAASVTLSADATFAGIDVQASTLLLTLAHSITLADTFKLAAGVALSKAGAGSFSVAGTQTHGAGASLAVTAGVVNLATDAGTSSAANLDISASGATAVVNFHHTQHIHSLTLAAAALAQLTTSDRTKDSQKVLVTHALAINASANAKLDLTNNDMVIDYTGSASPLATVAGLIASALNINTFAWDGAGITSSAAAADVSVTGMLFLGYMENNNAGSARTTTFPVETETVSGETVSGETVSLNAVLVKFTYIGDANLDGKVNIADYNILDYGYTHGLTGWYNGDTNYDGAVDVADYSFADAASSAQGQPL